MASSRRGADPTLAEPPRRTFVLDTSVVLADPRAPMRFAEHEVVLPVVVITELEAKRHHPELGYFARQALRLLDDLRVRHGRLDAPIPVGDGGTLRVELNHADAGLLPAGFRLGDNDTRILAVARSLAADGRHVTSSARTCPCGSRRPPWGSTPRSTTPATPVDSGWTGMTELEVGSQQLSALYAEQVVELPRRPTCPVTPASCCSPSAARRSAASCPTSGSASSAATATCSASTGAAPSSASRSTSCSTPTSGSCRWAAGPARASPRSRSAPASRR